MIIGWGKRSDNRRREVEMIIGGEKVICQIVQNFRYLPIPILFLRP